MFKAELSSCRYRYACAVSYSSIAQLSDNRQSDKPGNTNSIKLGFVLSKSLPKLLQLLLKDDDVVRFVGSCAPCSVQNHGLRCCVANVVKKS